MGRILAIDYGLKRVGLAVTDENRIIATGLDTIATTEIFDYLKVYFLKEQVDLVVIGEAKKLDNTPSQSAAIIEPFVEKFSNSFPNHKVMRLDERFTSKMAFQTMIDSGINKKSRRDKALIDKISATILLQSFMQSNY